MALADARRRFEDEHPRCLAIAGVGGERVTQSVEKTHLLRARHRAGGKVREEIVTHGRKSAPGSVQSYHGDVAERRPIFEFSAGGLVIDDEGRVLLIRARDLRNRPVWTLPKGSLNVGESSADAALREVREETGWRCELLRELEPVTYWFQRGGARIRKTVRWFLMRPLHKEGDHDHEVDEVAWADREEALKLLRYESDRRLLTDNLTSAPG
jgi:8-oxo-dGTP pyrophosphatase MutT (NUDIX family)